MRPCGAGFLPGRQALRGGQRVGRRVVDVDLDELAGGALRLDQRRCARRWRAGSAPRCRGTATCNVVVRSPAVLRRQAEMLGAFTPKRVSRKRSCEVWSKVSEHT